LRTGQVSDQAELQRTAESLERATRMQVQLIDDLLDVSRIVADKLALVCTQVDLGAEVQAAVDGVRLLANAKSLTICTALSPALEPIWADALRVQQVVANLLTNAIKFTPRGGKIRVTVSAVDGMAQLRVSDTGIGIDDDFLPHVFTRFSQRDRSITRKYGGLGLGLALVRHLVELQGGTASVESEGPGHGATFTVTFAFASRSEQAAGTPAPQPSHPLDRAGRTRRYEQLIGLRVLVIDDDQRTREALLEVLELAGARVELAASSGEGLAAVGAFEPQVILCDIAMPGEDGYTFMRKLRAQQAGHPAPIPALALTALAAEDDRRRALDAGFALHLTKPIDIDRLRDGVLELSKLATPTAAAPP
jgi:two-component system CheB/CheR fusion protein